MECSLVKRKAFQVSFQLSFKIIIMSNLSMRKLRLREISNLLSANVWQSQRVSQVV